MGLRNKIITAVFAILICTSAFVVTTYATETGSDIVTDIPTEGEIDIPDELVTDDPYVGDETYAPDEPATDYPYEETDPYYEPETEDPYYEDPTDYYEEPEYPDYTYPYIDDEPPYFSDGDDIYVGGGQSGYTVPDNTMPSAALYDADRPIDDKELSKNDWSEIAANLANAGSKENNNDDDGDFNFIKKNDSKTDNGDWMLYTGIALILLSLCGMTYAIVSAVKNKKSTAAFAGGKKPAYAHASHAKFDTADVKLPKGAKHAGGKRFK